MLKFKIIFKKNLYNFFLTLSLILFFFSTDKIYAKSFNINNIEISEPFELDFDKNDVIIRGFKKAYFELIQQIVTSVDQTKVNQITLNELKEMIETFSIKEEKFIDELYYVNLDVSFDKKKLLNYLEKKNVFPSIPLKKKIFFIPIIIDENKKELLIFSNNEIFSRWNLSKESYHLLEYILPTEDLEDINKIKSQFEFIEDYNFNEITKKYNLEDSIITLIFINNQNIRLLSKILLNNELVLKNKLFSNHDLNNDDHVKKIIHEMKIIYEDYWKNFNQINTSIRLPLIIKVDSSDNVKISKFEKILNENDLIYDFFISKFDKNFVVYEIIFNGTPNIFLKMMSENDKNFNTQNKIWILK
jgi:hypothetical protein